VHLTDRQAERVVDYLAEIMLAFAEDDDSRLKEILQERLVINKKLSTDGLTVMLILGDLDI